MRTHMTGLGPIATIVRRLGAVGGAIAVATIAAIAGSAGIAGSVALSAQETYRLASAQVVMIGDRPPVLKLTANGPIAFALLSEDEGQPAAPSRLIARFHGVAPGSLTAPGGTEPFAVSVRAASATTDSDAIVTITVAGLPPGQALTLRQGSRSNDVEVSIGASTP
jgi:hypothetical protein